MASGMEIFKLWGTIEINKNNAVSDIKAVDATAQKSSKNIQGNFGNIGKSFLKVSAIITAAAAAIGGALIALAVKTSNVADEIDKMSIRTGVSRERLQELKYVTSQTGVEFSSLQTAITFLTRSMTGAESGSQRQADAFAALGIKILDSAGNMRDATVVFDEVLNVLSSMENETERNAIALELFGRGAAELTPLFAAGTEGIRELSERAHEFGLVMDDEAIAANVKFKDTLDTLKRSIGALMMNLSNAVLPYIQKAVDWLLVNIPKVAIISEYVGEEIRLTFEYIPKLIGAVMQTLWDWLQKGWDWTINLVGDAWNWIKEDGWPWLVKTAETTWNWILSGFDWFKTNLLPWVGGIVKTTWNWVLTGFDWFRNNLFPWIGETAHSTWDWIVNGVSWLADNLVSSFISTWNWIVNGLDWIKDNLVAFFESTWEWTLQGLDWIKDNLTGFFETTWSWVLTGLDWIKDTATSWFWATINTTWNWITQGLDWIRNNVVPLIGSVVSTTWKWITSGLEWFKDNVLDLAQNTIETAWDWTVNFAGGIGSWIKDTALPWINGFVKTTWTWIADFFGSDLSWIVHTGAKWVNNVVSTIWDWTVNAAGTFWTFLQNFWGWISGTVKTAWDWTVDVAGAAWDSITEWVNGTVNTTWTWFSETATNIWNWTKDEAAPWLVSGVKTIWEWGSKALEGIWNWVSGSVAPWVLESVISIWKWTSEAVTDIWNWVKDEAAPWVVDGISSVWEWTSSTAKDIWSWVKDEAAPWLLDSISTAWNWIATITGEAWNSIKVFVGKTATTVWKWATSIFGPAWDFISKYVGGTAHSVWKWIVEIGGDMWETMKGWFGGISVPFKFIVGFFDKDDKAIPTKIEETIEGEAKVVINVESDKTTTVLDKAILGVGAAGAGLLALKLMKWLTTTMFASPWYITGSATIAVMATLRSAQETLTEDGETPAEAAAKIAGDVIAGVTAGMLAAGLTKSPIAGFFVYDIVVSLKPVSKIADMAEGLGKAEELFKYVIGDKTKTDINIQLGVDPIFAPMKEVDVEKELESLGWQAQWWYAGRMAGHLFVSALLEPFKAIPGIIKQTLGFNFPEVLSEDPETLFKNIENAFEKPIEKIEDTTSEIEKMNEADLSGVQGEIEKLNELIETTEKGIEEAEKKLISLEEIAKYNPTGGATIDQLVAIAAIESSFDATAVSKSNAKGLMQFNDITLDEIKRLFQLEYKDDWEEAFREMFGSLEIDPFDPEQAVKAADYYLSYLLDRFGNLHDALMAYNWGPTAMQEWIDKGRPDPDPENDTEEYIAKFEEATNYVKKFIKAMNEYSVSVGKIGASQREAIAQFEEMEQHISDSRLVLSEITGETAAQWTQEYLDLIDKHRNTLLSLESINEKSLTEIEDRLKEMRETMVNEVTLGTDDVYERFQWLFDVLVGHSVVPDLNEAIVDETKSGMDGMIEETKTGLDTLHSVWEEYQTEREKAIVRRNERLAEINQKAIAGADETPLYIPDLEDVESGNNEIVESTKETAQEVVNIWKTAFADVSRIIADFVVKTPRRVLKGEIGIFASIKELVGNLFTKVEDLFSQAITENVAGWIEGRFAKSQFDLGVIGQSTKVPMLTQLLDMGKLMFSQIGGALATGIQALLSATGPVGLVIIAAFTNLTLKLWGFASTAKKIITKLDELFGITQRIKDGFQNEIKPAIEQITAPFNELGKVIAKALLPVVKALAPVFEWLANGIMSIVKKIFEFTNSVIKAINWALGWLGVNIPMLDLGAFDTDLTVPDSPGTTGGGHQISEITGPTRDILIDLLSPLASLNSLVGIGNRIAGILDSRLPMMGELGFVAAGAGVTINGDILIQPQTANIDEITQLTAQEIERKIAESLSRSKRGAGR